MKSRVGICKSPLGGVKRLFVLPLAVSVLLCPELAPAASVQALFDLSSTSGGPFPSDRFTVPDASQNTDIRIALPKPDCAANPSDCADIDQLNELDGFNLSPRISIPFDGTIDLSTANSASILLVNLGSALPGGDPAGHVSGVDQVVWDPSRTTLHVESDEQLAQHTRYAVLVTKDVLDSSGKAVKASTAFLNFVDEKITGSTGDPALDTYRTVLRNALEELDFSGIVRKGQIIAASVFTTLSASANLEKVRDQIKANTPPPADFQLGPSGTRTVFPRSALTGLVFNRQMTANPGAPLSPMTINLAALDVIPGSIGSIALGKYTAPEYRVHPGEFIPQVGTRSGSPLVQGTAEITFLLVLPSAPKPALGYPVVIYGHGGNTNKSSAFFIASKMAEHGIATIAIDGPGSGFGPMSTYTITLTDLTSLVVRSGGRGMDQDADGRIDEGEGFSPAAPRAMLGLGRGDGNRQWCAEHMGLVRVIEVGVDVDADGSPDLDPSRIYYVGSSAGGRQGAIFLAIEPNVRAGVLNVPSGSAEDRLSASRVSLGRGLQRRTPSLINSPGVVSVDGVALAPQTPPFFNENLPLRRGAAYSAVLEGGAVQNVQSPLVNGVLGAMEIQQAVERAEWGHQGASSIVFASFLRRHPLSGVPAKSVIVQFPYGDRVIPNPSTTALLLGGDLADRATFFRSDLAFPSGNPIPIPANPTLYPHTFLQLFPNPALTARALQAQEQIASFFTLDGPDHALDPSDGSQISDPDPQGPIFEVPIVQPLPVGMNFPGSPAPSAQFIGTEPGKAGISETPQATGPRMEPIVGLPQPNPLNPSAAMTIHLPGPASVRSAVYDARGRLVRTLASGERFPAGITQMRWDGRNQAGTTAAAGVYFIRFDSGEFHATRKMVVLR